MSGEPLVSIVLPTFNGSRYLEEAIHSCLMQIYPSFELIVVDDGSTDDTPVRIARHTTGQSRIRAARHQSNRGLPAALNTGFSLAAGEYFTWTSDDNWYRPEALTRMVAYLRSHPDAHVVYSSYAVVDQGGTFRRQVVPESPWALLERNCIGPCFLFERRVYEVTGPYADRLFLAEDYDFWLRASQRFHLHPLNEDLYCYREHDHSLTATHRKRIDCATEYALARNLPGLGWAAAGAKGATYLRLAEAARDRGDVKRTALYMLWGLHYAPGQFVVALARSLSSRFRLLFWSSRR
jgi:glycosyltransferase involved in cell wall biosynthesis